MKQPLRLISKKLINNKEIEADPYSFALTTAHYALAPRAKSRAELHAHLKKRGVEDEIAAAVLDELELQGLLNDLEFAQIWSESRQRQKKLSKRSIGQELKFKGVSQDIIDETLENIDDEDEYKMAMTLAERKYRSCSHLDHDVVYRRVHGLLSRKGFSHSISGRIMRELLGSNDR
jgi:regulatory protein